MTPEEFKSIRKSLGVTQGKFAKQLGVSLRSVQRYEKEGVPRGPVRLLANVAAGKHGEKLKRELFK